MHTVEPIHPDDARWCNHRDLAIRVNLDESFVLEFVQRSEHVRFQRALLSFVLTPKVCNDFRNANRRNQPPPYLGPSSTKAITAVPLHAHEHNLVVHFSSYGGV